MSLLFISKDFANETIRKYNTASALYLSDKWHSRDALESVTNDMMVVFCNGNDSECVLPAVNKELIETINSYYTENPCLLKAVTALGIIPEIG